MENKPRLRRPRGRLGRTLSGQQRDELEAGIRPLPGGGSTRLDWGRGRDLLFENGGTSGFCARRRIRADQTSPPYSFVCNGRRDVFSISFGLVLEKRRTGVPQQTVVARHSP